MASRLGREVRLSWLSSWAWKWVESRTELRRVRRSVQRAGETLPPWDRTSVKGSLQRGAGE